MPSAMRYLPALSLVVCLYAVSACHTSSEARHSPPDQLAAIATHPEPATALANAGQLQQKQKAGRRFVAVTANPHASQAAYRVLNNGGSALDAAIAAQMVLGLVEPQSSGIGGGAFLLYWDASAGQLYSYDGRETAPLSATEGLFLDETGKPLSFAQAVVGGRSVGVPGILRMLEMAHDAHGKTSWHDLFIDAIDLAESGFPVSLRLHQLVSQVPLLDKREMLYEYLFVDGQPVPEGYVLKNKAYADSLREIAEGGADAFYRGALGQRVIKAVNSDTNAGGLSSGDFSDYRAVLREPVCKVVLRYNICGMGPPSSGASTVLSILAQLEQLLARQLIQQGQSINDNADTAHAFIEATRLAFADRNTYLADADFVSVPVAELLDDHYIASRAALIDINKQAPVVSAGRPLADDVSFVTVPGGEVPSTTHMSIVDGEGNIVSMTSSIESAFGSRLMVDGFLLNNQLTDFSFLPEKATGARIANRVQGGKRPLSSMSPMIIFNASNDPVMVLGSPGGRSIIAYVARVIYDHIVGGKDLSEAVSGKHVVATGKVYLEPGISESLVQALKAKGHSPVLRDQSSGISALHISPDGWVGVADPRREGTVAAE